MPLAFQLNRRNNITHWRHRFAYLLLSISLLVSGTANGHYCTMDAPFTMDAPLDNQTHAISSINDRSDSVVTPPCHEQVRSDEIAENSNAQPPLDNCCDDMTGCSQAASVAVITSTHALVVDKASGNVNLQGSIRRIGGFNNLPYRPPLTLPKL